MKILLMTPYGQTKILTTDILPRVGDSVDMFYSPPPVVQKVILWPREETLKGVVPEGTIDILILLK